MRELCGELGGASTPAPQPQPSINPSTPGDGLRQVMVCSESQEVPRFKGQPRGPGTSRRGELALTKQAP